MSPRVALLSVLAAVYTTIMHAAIATFFGTWGIPAFTTAFCIIASMFVLLQGSIYGAIAVEITRVTTPEGHLRRYWNRSNESTDIDENTWDSLKKNTDETNAESTVVPVIYDEDSESSDTIVPEVDDSTDSIGIPFDHPVGENRKTGFARNLQKLVRESLDYPDDD